MCILLPIQEKCVEHFNDTSSRIVYSFVLQNQMDL